MWPLAAPLLGTLIGGLITLVAFWLREVREKQKASQAWFEAYYITEGIDLVANELMKVAFRFVPYHPRWKALAGHMPDESELYGFRTPAQAILRTEVLLRTEALALALAVISAVSRVEHSEASAARFATLIDEGLLFRLHEIRGKLLGARVRSKNDVNLISKDEAIAPLVQQFREALREARDRGLEHLHAHSTKPANRPLQPTSGAGDTSESEATAGAARG